LKPIRWSLPRPPRASRSGAPPVGFFRWPPTPITPTRTVSFGLPNTLCAAPSAAAELIRKCLRFIPRSCSWTGGFGGPSLLGIVNWHSTYHILRFTRQETTDIFDNHIHQSRPRLAGGPSHVRRHEAVSRGEQRIIIRGRLYRENVDSGPSEPSVVERF